MALGDFLVDITVVQTFFILTFSWIVNNLWQRVIDNLLFGVLKLNKESFYQSVVIAISLTIIFLSFLINFRTLTADFSLPTGEGNEGGEEKNISELLAKLSD